MSQQLVVSINNGLDDLRWCWLTEGRVEAAAEGDFAALRQAVGAVAQHIWLLLPGAKVVTRELEYSEKEKKHLRNLLPFQLEESVIGDIDELHLAMGDAVAGKVALAYTDKAWLRGIFEQFAEAGLEVARCWSRSQLLPLQESSAPNEHIEPSLAESPADAQNLSASPAQTWAVNLVAGEVNVRFGLQQGFSLPLLLLPAALPLLIAQQGLAENLPFLVLSASSEAELASLVAAVPENLVARISTQHINDPWQLDFAGKAIDLCQADFSQRLPLERWIKRWRSLGILALVTFVVYVGVLMFHIHKLNKQNLVLRQQMEQIYRSVVPHGQSDDPEKRLRIKLAELQPKNQTGSLVGLLNGILPLIAGNPDITVKVVSYAADTGEMNINVQAHSFNSIDALRQTIASQGYNAELLTANAQGDLNTGRLKISKPQH